MSHRKRLVWGDLVQRSNSRDEERRAIFKVIGTSASMYTLFDICDGPDMGSWLCYRADLQRVVMSFAGPVTVED